jgi:hypothetical protein
LLQPRDFSPRKGILLWLRAFTPPTHLAAFARFSPPWPAAINMMDGNYSHQRLIETVKCIYAYKSTQLLMTPPGGDLLAVAICLSSPSWLFVLTA